MSGLVFFDDEANNDVLDEWMNNDSAVLAKGAAMGSELPTEASKGGLGFSEAAHSTKSKSSSTDNKPSKQHLLNKKKHTNVKLDQEDDELHGMVADIVEESRTSVISKKEKEANNNQKRKTEIEQPHNKKAKNATTSPAVANNVKGDNSNTTPAVSENEKKKQKQKQGSLSTPGTTKANATSTSAPGITATSAGSVAAQEEERRQNSRIRKRTKTRSKQKNIRKDNRSDTLKPAHLVVKNKEYKGRPLTERTKAVLGV